MSDDDAAQEPRTWLQEAQMYSDGAERALAAGDMEAWLKLTQAAAMCVRIARHLEDAEGYLQ